MKEKNQKKLNIGMLCFYYPHLGGSGIMTLRIAKNLAKKGHKIHFIGYDTDENPSELKDLGLELHRVRKIDYPCLKNEPYVWSLGSRICQVHEENGLDLIHAHYAVPHALSAFSARESLKQEGKYLPYVVTGHGSDIHTNGSKDDINPLLRLCLDQADALTYVSQDLKNHAETRLGIRKEGIHIPNFVDLDEFHSKETNLRSELKIPQKAFVVGHVSNFAPIKRTYEFSYLAEHLKSRGILENIYFLMCGDGRERSKLEERVEKIDAAKQFIFTGELPLKKLVDAYNVMDVLLLPSKREGNSLALLEAMACKKATIGMNSPGIRETIHDVGYLFENTLELVDIIYNLKNNRDFGEESGKKGFEKVKKEYSKQKVIDKYLDVYNSVLNPKK